MGSQDFDKAALLKTRLYLAFRIVAVTTGHCRKAHAVLFGEQY